MIVIRDINTIPPKIKINYDPLTDFTLAMDLLTLPEHQLIHTSWAESVLKSLSRKHKEELYKYRDYFKRYLHLDEYLRGLDTNNIFPINEVRGHLSDLKNWNLKINRADLKKIVTFLIYMWDTYIFQVILDHKTSILNQIETGNNYLPNNYDKLLTDINERISIHNNILKMQKWFEMDVSANNVTNFIISPLIFVFPYLVMDWQEDTGRFFLGWETPFKGNDRAANGIDSISRVAFALSDKSRLRMLLVLKNEPMSQKDLGEYMGFAKSTMSKHVNILLNSKILVREEYNKTIYLKLNEDTLNGISGNIKDWLNQK